MFIENCQQSENNALDVIFAMNFQCDEKKIWFGAIFLFCVYQTETEVSLEFSPEGLKHPETS